MEHPGGPQDHAERVRPPARRASDRRLRPIQRHRRAGGPQDVQTVACGCGSVFRAPVVTAVTCPDCLVPQAW